MSSQTGNESTEQSSIISTFLTNVLEKVRQDGPQETERLNAVLETVIRKAAHMAEYAILFLLSYLAMVKISKSENRIYNKLTAALISFALCMYGRNASASGSRQKRENDGCCH